MRACEQITRPGRDTLPIRIIVGMNSASEFRKRVRVVRYGAAQDQAITQIAQNCFLFGEHKAILWIIRPVGRLPSIGPVVPAQGNRGYKSFFSCRNVDSGSLKWM